MRTKTNGRAYHQHQWTVTVGKTRTEHGGDLTAALCQLWDLVRRQKAPDLTGTGPKGMTRLHISQGIDPDDGHEYTDIVVQTEADPHGEDSDTHPLSWHDTDFEDFVKLCKRLHPAMRGYQFPLPYGHVLAREILPNPRWQ